MHLSCSNKRTMDLQTAEQCTSIPTKRSCDDAFILRLNFDCLYHIFSFLKLQELMVAEEVCTRFEEVAAKTYKSFKMLDFSDDILSDLNSPKAIKAACRVGPYVSFIKSNYIILDSEKENFAKFLRIHFKNLQQIYLQGCDIQGNKTITNFSIAFKGVKEVVIDTCKLSDNNFKMLFQVNQLQVLKCYYNEKLDGTFLEGLTRNLRELTLCFCPNVKSKLFKEFCKKHPNLKSLDISALKCIDKSCLSTIAAHLRELEILKISDSYKTAVDEDYINLGDLPMLKHLKIVRIPWNSRGNRNLLIQRICMHNQLESLAWCHRYITHHDGNDRALRNLTKLKELHINDTTWLHKFTDSTLESLSTSLQKLHIPHSDVSPKHLELFVKRCQFLQLLNVRHCRNIDENFIPQILPHLRGRSHMLELVITDWQLSEEIREELKGIYVGRNSTKLMLTIMSNKF